MGVVYKALDTKLDHNVALKVVHARELSDPLANADLVFAFALITIIHRALKAENTNPVAALRYE